MAHGIITGDPHGFNKGRSLKFRVGSRVRQTSEEVRAHISRNVAHYRPISSQSIPIYLSLYTHTYTHTYIYIYIYIYIYHSVYVHLSKCIHDFLFSSLSLDVFIDFNPFLSLNFILFLSLTHTHTHTHTHTYIYINVCVTFLITIYHREGEGHTAARGSHTAHCTVLCHPL